MRKIYILLTLLFFSKIIIFSSDLNIGGYIRNYNSLNISDDMEFVILQNSLDLNMEYYSSIGAILINPYLNINEDEADPLDLREIYIDLYFYNADLRIGRQQVIWGKADGLFITDVVSPKNLEDFLLPDFREIRLGVDGVKLDYYLGISTIELIWVPLFRSNTMPEVDSIWNISGIDFSESDDLDPTLDNGEIFFRYSIMTSIFDLEVVGGSMWDDEPVITSYSPLILEYKRLKMFGGSFSSTLGNFILRSEGAYFTGKGLSEQDYINYMVGLDYGFSGYKMSMQFVQEINIDSKDYENSITFMFNKSFLGETLKTEFFTYIELDDLNALLKPKLVYDFDDSIDIILGGYIFLGDSGTYGQFDDNDMFYTQVKYSF